MNYAVPNTITTRREIQSLEKFFVEKDRVPRLEYFADLNPELEAMLVDAGFSLEFKAPLMIVDRDQLVLVPRNLARRIELRECEVCMDATNESFGIRAEEAPLSIESFRANVEAGRYRVAAVFDSDLVVAAGCLVGKLGTVELAGVGCRPAYRRRGFATMVSSRLCEWHFDEGGDRVWLSAADAHAESLYAKLGFNAIGFQLNYSKRSN